MISFSRNLKFDLTKTVQTNKRLEMIIIVIFQENLKKLMSYSLIQTLLLAFPTIFGVEKQVLSLPFLSG